MTRHADFSERSFCGAGEEDLSECHEGSATIADEPENNLICSETAHDAPVNALTKIEAIRRAHGVRVDQQGFQFKRLTATRKTLLEKRIATF